jgi:membrane protein DedA with SNARE-associated domain
MLESLISFVQNLPPWGILLAAFLIPIVEHLFPPAPCDLLLLFLGTLVGLGTIGLVPLNLMALGGSIVGFAIVYYVGLKLGRSVIDSGRLKFLPVRAVIRVEKGFARYGYWVICGNRFLSGIRPVVPLFAGMAKLPLLKCLAGAALSACVWNALLVGAGMTLGARWREVHYYLETYARVLTPILIVVVVVAVVRWLNRPEKSTED